MDKESHSTQDDWIKGIIAEELTPQGDLVPPWMRYPEIPRYSIGWRMGNGESYMWAWDTWAENMKQEQLVEYFKKYLPIPLAWLDWVAYRLGFPNLSRTILSGEGSIAEVHWLEEQGLANFIEFKHWFENLPRK